MKKIFFFSILIIKLGFCENVQFDPHFQLVFEDEFNTLNTNVWDVPVRQYWGGNWTYMTDSYKNIHVSNGFLNLIALLDGYNGLIGSSSEIVSKQLFGAGLYFEIQSKIPPAGASVDQPASGGHLGHFESEYYSPSIKI